jgi:hypothetical protein
MPAEPRSAEQTRLVDHPLFEYCNAQFLDLGKRKKKKKEYEFEIPNSACLKFLRRSNVTKMLSQSPEETRLGRHRQWYWLELCKVPISSFHTVYLVDITPSLCDVTIRQAGMDQRKGRVS